MLIYGLRHASNLVVDVCFVVTPLSGLVFLWFLHCRPHQVAHLTLSSLCFSATFCHLSSPLAIPPDFSLHNFLLQSKTLSSLLASHSLTPFHSTLSLSCSFIPPCHSTLRLSCPFIPPFHTTLRLSCPFIPPSQPFIPPSRALSFHPPTPFHSTLSFPLPRPFIPPSHALSFHPPTPFHSTLSFHPPTPFHSTLPHPFIPPFHSPFPRPFIPLPTPFHSTLPHPFIPPSHALSFPLPTPFHSTLPHPFIPPSIACRHTCCHSPELCQEVHVSCLSLVTGAGAAGPRVRQDRTARSVEGTPSHDLVLSAKVAVTARGTEMSKWWVQIWVRAPVCIQP